MASYISNEILNCQLDESSSAYIKYDVMEVHDIATASIPKKKDADISSMLICRFIAKSCRYKNNSFFLSEKKGYKNLSKLLFVANNFSVIIKLSTFALVKQTYI